MSLKNKQLSETETCSFSSQCCLKPDMFLVSAHWRRRWKAQRGISYNSHPCQTVTSPWIAGTPLITAEIACHLYPPSLPRTLIDVSSGGELRASPNYSHSKTFNASVGLIHCTAYEICNADGTAVPLRGIPNDRSPFQAFARLLRRNSLPSVFHIYLAVITPQRLRVFCQSGAPPPPPLNFIAPCVFIDIYMKARNDLDMSNA